MNELSIMITSNIQYTWYLTIFIQYTGYSKIIFTEVQWRSKRGEGGQWGRHFFGARKIKVIPKNLGEEKVH